MNVIVITGASEGIGAEMARQWALRGGDGVALVLAARHLDRLEAVATSCRASGATVVVRRCDVGVQEDCIELIAAAMHGFGRIDTLVNNAGVSAQALFADVSDLDWTERLMRVNHWGSVWCTHAALQALKASRGRIVAISSLAGLVGVPGRTAYCSSKFAMTGFFEALRVELAVAGVSVTIAYPGVVATQIRHHGLNARGETAGGSGLDERGAMSVKECAGLIVNGAEARQRDIVMTAKGKFGRWLKLIAPGVVDRLALAALKQEARPR